MTATVNPPKSVRSLRVLIVEDSPLDAELTVQALSRGGYDLTWERVETAAAMTDALARGPWDIILSDYSLPTFSGLAALRVMQSTVEDVPFMIVSGTIDEDTAVSALKAGACDFMLKGHLARLLPAIERELRDVDLRRERARTQAVLEDRLRQAQKMQAVGQLAGGIAHDFNNLLTAILGYCELVMGDLDPIDPRYADVAEIQKAGMSAAWLTRQLLAFSRKAITEPIRLDLNAVVADMRPMLGRLIREDVTIVLSLATGLAAVMADRGQVEQIVMNLAVNARDAMPHGGTLTIETVNIALDEHYAAMHPTVVPGPYVGLIVTDTGTGMTPEVQARLFEPFFTTKEPGKGTGLGMATVHGIATQSGGTVGVYSELGRGTSFKVYFPRADGTAATVDAPLPVIKARAGVETVLVVEDADGLRELAKRLLEKLGYTVLVAENAEDALRLFEEYPSIDVLLTDVVMPGISGPDLTRRLIQQQPALRVIYMSGYTEDTIVHRGVLDPGIAFLHKPFTADVLGRKIREVLDRTGRRL
jgi:two-component system, cell cycle sensor histidine kinase and response regulator CckA